MIRSGKRNERHTIPRWNSTEVGQKLGELDSLSIAQADGRDTKSVESLLTDWRYERSFPLAIEILSETALTNSGTDVNEVVEFAKKTIEDKQKEIPLLGLLLKDYDRKDMLLSNNRRQRVGEIKARLVNNPYNPLLWADLAREYLILGQPTKCEKALIVARNLSPNNRAVIRALARFYTHESDYEKAQYYLLKSPIIRNDPWVLASEIAISNEMKKVSRNIKYGILMLENNNICPKAKSELAAELATMDFVSANSKNGKKKLAVACISPHENAVAQITWINDKAYSIPGVLDEIQRRNVECNFEAETGWFSQKGAWSNALAIASKWQAYQPFSRTPALVKSEIALNYANKIDDAIQSLEEALLSNPCETGLLNNLAYAYALQGNKQKTQQMLEIAASITDVNEDPVLIATSGLYQYRFGYPEEGKKMYQLSIKKADSLGKPELSYAATVYFAREELRCKHDASNLMSFLTNKKNERYYKAYYDLIHAFNLPV